MANSKYRNKLAGKGKNKRKGSNSSTNRDYSYDKAYQASPEQKKNRASRNAARAAVVKKKGKAAVKGKDVDHKNGSPTDNSAGNLRIESKKKNRGRKKR